MARFGIRALTGDPMSDHIPIQEAELDCLRASREELILQIRHAQEIIERSQELLLLLEQMLAEAGPPCNARIELPTRYRGAVRNCPYGRR